jgi:hypothetical protein
MADPIASKRLEKIDKKLAKGGLKKKEFKALDAERSAILLANKPKKKHKDLERDTDLFPEANLQPHLDIITEAVEKAGKAFGKALDAKLAEPAVAPQHPHLEHLSRVGELNLIITDSEQPKPIGFTKAEKKAAQKELDETAAATLARLVERTAELKAQNLANGMTPEPAKQWAAKEAKDEARKVSDPVEVETDDAIKARVQAKRAARKAAEKAGEQIDAEAGERAALNGDTVAEHIAKRVDLDDETKARILGTDHEDVDKIAKSQEVVAKVFADPEAVQPRDRWGRPLIVPVGGGKPEGYKRTTTFIDVLDDKSNLTDWKTRIVVTGVAAIEQKAKGEGDLVDISEVGAVSVLDRVEAANRDLAKAAKKADKLLKNGVIDEDEYGARHDEAEKQHKSVLKELAAEAFEAGDGFVKAETGTRIHKLTELHDLGQPMPDDVTSSELRDIAAYAAALKKLNVEILAVEQFVVIDELKVAGTLDRRIRYDSPALGRRITAIGDVKTGRVDFGAGKMTRQLAAYAMGKGYDWTKPEERVTFRTNREYGLIFHLAAGKGVCDVYEIDLKKGAEGLKLCAQVFAHRSETSTSKVFSKIGSSK